MPIYQQGTINTTALSVPDLYVQVAPPQPLLINGVPSNRAGIVGTACWGPVNTPVIVGSISAYNAIFGPTAARKYDIGTALSIAVQQGASDFRCVRVTDGTDMAASYAFSPGGGSYAVNFMAKYTGSFGNQISFSLARSSAPNSWRLTVSLPGYVPEIYDRLQGATPSAFWETLARAVNNGISASRGPSALISAQLGSNSSQGPSTLQSQPLLGGSDGANGVSGTTLLGQDGLQRTGVYALRGQGCALAMLADCDDPLTWSIQAQFGESEAIYMILAGAAGQAIPDAITTKQEAGLDSYAAKLLLGDYLYWHDQSHAQIRLVSPQGFVLGRLANLSPEQSSLNKPLYGVIGSQRSGSPSSSQMNTYTTSELATLFSAGIDVISNPQPGGSFWGVRCGHNSSNNSSQSNDSYSRLTNFISSTLSSGMGSFVGAVITPTLFRRIRSTLLSFLHALLEQGVLGRVGGKLPYSVVCDLSNNPPSRTALGYVQADVQIQYQGINEQFIVNLDAGQSVVVSQQTLPNTPAQ